MRARWMPLLALCATGCGARTDLVLEGPPDAAIPDVGVDAPCAVVPEGCSGLQCQAALDNCSCRGLPPTTISGTVYDPAGRLPLYNVYVYIPNGTPEPITPGSPTCTACQAPASGSPILGVATDESGAFHLAAGPTGQWGVPSGDNVPLVLQLGKWRRQVTIPHVEACTDNKLPDPPVPKEKLRLPSSGREGDMPLIAFTSGCDLAECFLRNLGIDDSEFVPQGGPGHVHFFTGRDVSSSEASGSAVYGGGTSVQTYDWMTLTSNLLGYDLVYHACECDTINRGTDATTALHDYLGQGGRVFAGHFFYNFFAPPDGPADFQSLAEWTLPEDPTAKPFPNFFIDTTFPKGQAFGTWIANLGEGEPYAQVFLEDPREAVRAVRGQARRWLYNAVGAQDARYETMYFSFTTPLSAPVEKQCGRAALDETHVLPASSNDATFPGECQEVDPAVVKTDKQRTLEFLFFDLFSCVQDEGKPPAAPPWQ